jgi:hypothetical protein
MKKFYMILAAIAAFAISAQAQNMGTIYVGDWEDASPYNGSYFDMAPTNFYLAHTGAQMIYTPDLLTDLDGKQNVKITGLKFKFNNETFEEIVRNTKVYLQEIDATEFALNDDGIKQFFEFGELISEDRLDIELVEYYGEDCTIEFPVDFEFTPGKSLLVTIVFDAEDDDNCTMGSDYASFYTSGIRGKAMTYTDNWESFVEYAQGTDWPNATATLGCGTNVELPVTEISYTYEEEQPVVEEGFFLVGSFNDWNQTAEGGRLAFDESDKLEGVELAAGAEFKVIAFDEDGTIWFGGQDENNVGYFLLNDDFMGQGIMTVQGNSGANFRVEEAGTYNIQLAVLRDFNGAVFMIVTKEDPSAISTVGVDSKADNAYYNLMGVKYNSMPTVPGIYIHNGKKVVVK